jgi:predicted Fe-Mo cluster-binding NifX family protein
MKIAIAVNVANIDAEVAERGARAPFYLIFDEKGLLQAAPTNPLATSDHDAGPQAAKLLAGHGVSLVASGDFGPHFVAALDARGINHIRKTGRAGDVIAELVPDEESDV